MGSILRMRRVYCTAGEKWEMHLLMVGSGEREIVEKFLGFSTVQRFAWRGRG